MPENVAGRLPIVQRDGESCGVKGYNVDVLMKETSSLRKLITQMGTLDSTEIVLFYRFSKTLKVQKNKKALAAKPLQ